MNELAKGLNQVLNGTIIDKLLSDFGKRFYFPKGIVAQSSEARTKAHKLNATIGMATKDGQPLHLSVIKKCISELHPKQIFAYAPTPGLPELRRIWKQEMIRKNPGLEGKDTSLPLLTSGLTHGISVAADLFVDPGDTVIIQDMFWGNYRLIFEGRKQAKIITFPFFNAEYGLNVQALRDELEKVGDTEKAILMLNFPNNPTGYSPTTGEAEIIVRILKEQADKGSKLMVVTDDAYFGLFYEDETYKQSLFAELSNLHENILAVKIDGATKEDFVWGFRLGFITFASKGLTTEHYDALTQKVMGAVRSSVSNSNHLGQSLLLKALNSDSYCEEKEKAFTILEARYRKVKEILKNAENPLEILPFNSGYFMTLYWKDGSTETLRRMLLDDYGIGTISIQDRYLRIAYSSVPLESLEELYSTVFDAVDKLMH